MKNSVESQYKNIFEQNIRIDT